MRFYVWFKCILALMKKLFLSSVAYMTVDKVIPMLPDVPEKLKLAFVPTAANPYTSKIWMYKDRDALVEMGFEMMDIDVEGKTKDTLREVLSDIDVLFVAGGNTFYLLKMLEKVDLMCWLRS